MLINPTRQTTCALLGLLLSIASPAGAVTWVGDGDGFSFNDPDNWNPAAVPGPGDTATFNSGPTNVSFGSPVTNALTDVSGTFNFLLNNNTYTTELTTFISGDLNL